jgi:hypothetical protein
MQSDWRFEVLVAVNMKNLGVLRHDAMYEVTWHIIL